MFQHLKFAVRYWSSLLPGGYCAPDTAPHWVDHSLHPASKLGLHNALLVRHDRLEILAADGGYYDCAVFAVGDGEGEMLSPAMAEKLFAALPHGDIRWLALGHCGAAVATGLAGGREPPPPTSQLSLFPHVHTPYDDLDVPLHRFDLDA
ncbi:MAG: hypothetical protein HYU78_16955 [Rhodocyclales bacterium]|nr:hypothetical protein [Rhodocyclales bacterium]